ncbi:MAG: sigma-70 family RNA polymerase sigma factor [Candidatus Marinimicrobia bacterium]|nr:sigma-70 family RNA polymerase sigma factor [Candidatus Neomarinimicrobiota bacterium]
MENKIFNNIVRENHEKVYSLFRGMVQTHEEADDLTQETFIKVYKNLDKFKGNSKMFTWIYRIAVNTGINYLRKERLKQIVGLEKIDLRDDDEPQALTNQAREILTRGIKKLPAKQQMVIMLRSYQELSYREIANIMDVTVNSAKVNFSHAVRNLKDILEKMGVNYDTL